MPSLKIYPKRRLIQIVLAIQVLGISLSILIYWVLYDHEVWELKQEFEQLSTVRAKSVDQQLQKIALVINSLESFFNASEKVTRAEFKKFSSGLIQTQPEIQALEWIPRITAGQRDAFEAQRRQQFNKGFRITSRNTQGMLVNDKKRTEYFPVDYLVPVQGNEAAIGFNLASDQARSTALNKARNTGQITASSRITLVQETAQEYGFLVFKAVYSNKSTRLATRIGELKGFVLGVFRVPTLFNAAIRQINQTELEITSILTDVTDTDSPKILYEHHRLEFDENIQVEHESEISFAGRKWKIVNKATRSISKELNLLPPLAATSAMIFSFLLCLFIYREGVRKILSEKDRARMQRFFDAAMEGLFYHENGTVIDVNPSGAELLGYKPDEIIGKSMFDFFVPEYQEESKKKIQGDIDDVWEAEVILKNGANLSVEVKRESTEIDGRPVHIVAVRDIQSRKKAESATKRIAAELTLLIDTANAPIFGVNTDGKVNEWNQKIAEISGFTKDEVLGHQLVEEFIVADFRDSVSTFINAALNGSETSNFELPIFTKNHSNVMMLLNTTSRRDIEGNIVGVVGVGQDITELVSYRTEMEQKVAERTRELNAILTLSPDGFVMVNEAYNVVYINPAMLEMTGFTQEEIVNESATKFTEKMRALFDTGKETPDCRIGESGHDQVIYLVRPTIRVINCTQRTMRAANGDAQGQVLYFRDITHETEVDAMKSEFLSTAAHELRTPLASIYGFSELLMHRSYDKKTTQEMVETIHRQSLNLKHLLDELLDLSRIEARSGKDFYMEAGSLKNLIDQCRTEIMGTVKERQVNIENLESWPLISFDEEKMHQVFINLLSNAFKYSADSSDVTISTCVRTKQDQQQFGVSVHDHGIGMTAQQLARVGERFYRADASGAISGTGLGVALVKEILAIHSGELEIASDIGVGTTATVWLPVVGHLLEQEKVS